MQPGLPNPVCVRAEIRTANGSYLEGEWLRPTYPNVEVHGKAMAPDTVVQVPAGTTQIRIGRGPDYKPQTISKHLSGDTTLDVVLDPVFNLYGRGWRTADLHMHYIHGEGEIIRPPRQVWSMCSAGGLDAAFFCEEHYGAGQLTRQEMYDLWESFDTTETHLRMGVEEPKNAWGHYANTASDPWSIRSAIPYSLGIRSVHEQGGVSTPVHPARLFPGRYYDDPGSGSRFWFLYPYNNFLKSYPLDALTGHLMDGWSGLSDEAHNATLLPPYFQLLNSGYRIPLVADSDICFDRINNGNKAPGFWTTYYYLGGEPLSRASISEAMRKGRVMATTGPLVLFTIDSAIPGDTLPANGAARTVRIEANHSFNPWTLKNTTFEGAPCQISQIDLFRNGQIVQTWMPNAPTATVQKTIHETSNAWYMVRVLGNQSLWMAGYASPIYFGEPRPRQPRVFKPIVQGRLYDAGTGNALTGTVSSVRYGQTDWTIATDSRGRFKARVPVDADLVARDAQGRTFTQNILRHESVYAFCHYLPETHATNQASSIVAFSNLVSEMRWEFPMGYAPSASYVRSPLNGDASLANFSVLSGPSHTAGKSHAEIAMLLIDKTRVQPGDTINFSAIYHSRQSPPSGQLAVEWKGWDPGRPSMYNKANKSFGDFNNPAGLVHLGGGYYLRSGSVVVPAWATNVTPSTGGILMYVTVRPAGNIAEDAQLLLPVGPTRRELLVCSTWDGFPASWSETGVGPCNFRRNYTGFQVRYSDYRNLSLRLNLNGNPLTINPKADTAHVADADDSIFYEQFYFDGQCEPKFRNVNFRDPVRTQPAATDFSQVPLQDPPDTTPPIAIAIKPEDGTLLPEGTTWLYFSSDDAGLSDPGPATVFVDGKAVTNTHQSPLALNLPRGQHTWHVQCRDAAGNSSFSRTNKFIVGSLVADTTPPEVRITNPPDGAVVSGADVLIAATAQDNTGVAGVQFQLNEANLGSIATTAPYSLLWNTTALQNGTYRLRAIARDAAQNQATSSVIVVQVQNVVQTNAIIWVEDSTPAQALLGSEFGDSWTWAATNPTPYSGNLAHHSTAIPGLHQHFFWGAQQTLAVRSNDVLFAYVYLDPANVPSEIMLQWNNGNWEHRAFWGEDRITLWGQAGTPSRYYAGPLPPAGQWARLAVPAREVALEGSVLNGMAFALFDGAATWDYAGKIAAPTLPPSPVLTGTFSNGIWRVQCPVTSEWSYALERSTNLVLWEPFGSTVIGQTNLVLIDTNQNLDKAFYRLRVTTP